MSLIFFGATIAVTAARDTLNFDFGWRHWLGPHPGYNTSTVTPCVYPQNLTATRCNGLKPARGARTAEECEAAACIAKADVWTWWLNEKADTDKRCHVGLRTMPGFNCVKDTLFVSGGTDPGAPASPYQPPVPAPQTCPDSPTCGKFDDSEWRAVDVPHDFIVEGTFQSDADRGHGYLPFNTSFYRKQFAVAADWQGRNIWLDFDGVYRASDFWLNGVYLGHHESGYTAFRWYLHNTTAPLHYGEQINVIAVRVDAISYQEGWFYEGGGIYRHVKLHAADPVGIVPWGVYAPSLPVPGTPIHGTLAGPQTADTAVVMLQIDIASALPQSLGNVSASVTNVLYNANGAMVAKVKSSQVLPPGGWARVKQTLHWPSQPPADGYIVQLAECDGSAAQKFRFKENRISIDGANGEQLCVDSSTAQPDKPPMVLRACREGTSSQMWTRKQPTPSPCQGGACLNNVFTLTSSGWRCLDTYGVIGPQLDVFRCIGNKPSQEFVVDQSTSTIVSAGRCLAAMPATMNGLHVTYPSRRSSNDTAVTDTFVNLWNLNSPYLYTIETTTNATVGGVTYVDSVRTTIGVRSAVFSADHGFLLNGQPQKIKGLSMHQDVGGCGTAVPERVNELRVTSLKEMGATGWRTAHNPVNSELLDFTDRYGMLVWSENRNLERQVVALDTNGEHNENPSVSGASMMGSNWKGVDPMYLDDVQAMVLRDRNHPSIVIWSLCNEAGCMQQRPDGGYVAAAFKKAIFDVDSSRPITANSEDRDGDTLTKVMDVNSFSYNYDEYDAFHLKYPFRTIIGGESASCTTDRGRYLGMGVRSNNTMGWVDADDTSCQISAWGTSAATRPWIVGNFAWTGWDYKGEPTPSNWPAINSHFGIFDIAGFAKDAYWYYRSWWRNDSSVLHILPQDWNAPVALGAKLDCVVFSAGDTVELIVNGETLGRQSVPSLGVVRYNNVTFRPGSLVARSWDAAGRPLTNTTVKTTTAPAQIQLTIADSRPVLANGQDVALVRVAILDEAGNLVPNASNNITFSVSGPGRVYGVANGDPVDHDPDKATFRRAFKGLARVILQATLNPGQVQLRATAAGLRDARLVFSTVAQ